MAGTHLAIIGGTGLTHLPELEIRHREVMHTPFGEPSGPLLFGLYRGHDVLFLPRHGAQHSIPPHRINYRANLWALRQAGVSQIIAVAAVGGITPQMSPAAIVIPDQIIDYTDSRSHTFFEGDEAGVHHVDMTWPYDDRLRQCLIASGTEAGIPVVAGGTYGATQGPRLETAAEINRMERDGCDIVGMTGMPEATLARELELAYACCAVVANWAAGRSAGTITMDEVERNLQVGMEQVKRLLPGVIQRAGHLNGAESVNSAS